MPSRQTLAAPLAQSMRAMLLGELEAAVDDLRRPRRPDVHSARKHGKRLRAELRLLRPLLGHAQGRALEQALSAAARCVAASREAEVMRRTLDALCQRHPATEDILAPWRPALEARLRRHRRRGDPAGACARLRALQEPFGQLALDRLDATLLETGLRQSYRAARRAGRRCRRSPADVERAHDWRKASKRHAMHCELLRPLWPTLKPRAQGLDGLNEQLGEHHDWADLAAMLSTLLDPPALAPVQAAIEAEQARCLAQALKASRALFEARPKRWSPATACGGRPGSRSTSPRSGR